MASKKLFNQDIVDHLTLSDIHNDLRTIQDYIRWIYSHFTVAELFFGHGYSCAWEEAQQLVLASLHLPYDLPEAYYTCALTHLEKQQLIPLLIDRLQHRKPLAYLTHRAYFCGLEFYVDERVIIPRSPIGELIQNHFVGLTSEEPQRILDMCTGSGCIAIACANEFPHAYVDAVDISLEALEIAQHNLEFHGLQEQIALLESDLFTHVPQNQYDIIISNPPYVDAEDIADMPEEYTYEPQLALEAGQDGLDLVKRLLKEATHYLTDNGILICEVGNSQVHLTAQYPHVPFTWLEFERGGDGVFMLTRQQLQHYFA